MSDEQLDTVEVTWANLRDIWLDGFASGGASALLTVSEGKCPSNQAEAIAQYLAKGIQDDPLSRAEVDNEIRERLAGEDSGPKEWAVDPGFGRGAP